MKCDCIPFSDLLSHVVDNRGKTCPTAEMGIPLIATNCITNELLYPAYDKVRYVSRETYDTWFRGHPRPGDLIFVTKGSPGRVCVAPDPVDFCIAQDMVALRADNKKVYPNYLFAVLRSPQVQAQIERMHVGTLIPHFKKGDFDKLLLPVPDRATQVFVGDLYFLLSAKMDLNRRTNETLEAIARALFKSWFVDFDPVRAKAAGRDPGIPPRLAALFPESVRDSEVGQIPVGWQVNTLSQHLAVEKGLSYKGAGLSDDGGVPMHNLNSVHEGGGYKHEGIKFYKGEYKPRHTVCPGDVVVANTEQGFDYLLIGFPAIVPNEIAQPGIFSHHLYRVRPLKGSSLKTHFIYHLLMTPVIRDQITGCTNGTTVNMLSVDGLRIPSFVLPSAQLAAAFEATVAPMYARVEQHYTQSCTLAALRDLLLPNLLSGAIGMKRAGHYAETQT